MMTDGFRTVGFYSTGLVAFCLQSFCNLSSNHSDLFRKVLGTGQFPV